MIDLNNQFLNEGKLANVEHDLEMYYNAVRTGKNTLKIRKYLEDTYEIEKDERQNLVNYLVHLEGIATLINNGMLRLSSINDLMAYRFFIAVNNPIVQDFEICQYQEYYQRIINLNKAWVPELLIRKKSTIPLYELRLGCRKTERGARKNVRND